MSVTRLMAALALALVVLAGCQSPKTRVVQDSAELGATTIRPRVKIETSMGPIVVELFPQKAPITVENFLTYVDADHYDGTIFHRVVTNFVVQGGGYTPELEQREVLSPIPNESDNGLRNRRGTVAMARLDDPDSATCQFFFNVTSNPALDFDGGYGGYTVFGRVVSGIEVIDIIASVPTEAVGDFNGVPVKPVLIERVYRLGSDA